LKKHEQDKAPEKVLGTEIPTKGAPPTTEVNEKKNNEQLARLRDSQELEELFKLSKESISVKLSLLGHELYRLADKFIGEESIQLLTNSLVNLRVVIKTRDPKHPINDYLKKVHAQYLDLLYDATDNEEVPLNMDEDLLTIIEKIALDGLYAFED